MRSWRSNGHLVFETPPDPRTGTTLLTLDALQWIHRITAHIPDPHRQGQRYYGAYSNRARAAAASAVCIGQITGPDMLALCSLIRCTRRVELQICEPDPDCRRLEVRLADSDGTKAKGLGALYPRRRCLPR